MINLGCPRNCLWDQLRGMSVSRLPAANPAVRRSKARLLLFFFCLPISRWQVRLPGLRLHLTAATVTDIGTQIAHPRISCNTLLPSEIWAAPSLPQRSFCCSGKLTETHNCPRCWDWVMVERPARWGQLYHCHQGSRSFMEDRVGKDDSQRMDLTLPWHSCTFAQDGAHEHFLMDEGGAHKASVPQEG